MGGACTYGRREEPGMLVRGQSAAMERGVATGRDKAIAASENSTRVGEGRNYGLDYLRLISIVFVVTLHVLGHGGVLASAEGSRYAAAYLLEAAAYCAVDCFVLISGFCMYGKAFKSRRIVSLWLEAFFYSVVIAIVMVALDESHTIGIGFVDSFFPVMTNQWWFFTQYFALAVCMPLLNVVLAKIEAQSRTRALLLAVVVMFSVVPFLAHLDMFKMAGGYSFIWFSLLYLLGGALRCMQTEQQTSKHPKALGFSMYVIGVLLTWAPFTAMHFVSVPEYFMQWKDFFYSYTSPFVLASAIGLLIAFSHLKVRNRVSQAVIAWITPAVFAVYLISDHREVRAAYVKGAFAHFASAPPLELLACVAGTVLVIVIACLLIEKVRLALFKVLRIDKCVKTLCDRLDQRIRNM